MKPNNSRCIIIAEAGVNHNGDPAIAGQMVEIAAKAGVDYIKFQTFTTEKLVTREAKQAAYQQRNLHGTGDNSQYAMLKRLELGQEEHYRLEEHCRRCGIGFLSTAFDVDNLRFINGLNIDYLKIPSGELTNYPYLCQVASFGKPVILSTGMADLSETVDAVTLLEEHGLPRSRIVVLHCTTEYPAPPEEVNLNALATLRNATGCKVGYSDHTMGIEIAIAAVALGAQVIEKHFTLDRTLPGPDQAASLEPGELARLVCSIRTVEAALGDGIKKPSRRERENAEVARKSIVAARNIARGERFTEENLTTKRPGSGISPMRWREILERTAKRDFAADELIEL